MNVHLRIGDNRTFSLKQAVLVYQDGTRAFSIALGERLFCQRIHPSEWRSPTDYSSRRLSWPLVKPCWAEAKLSCEISGRQQANTSGVRAKKR
jgi:hypothetical protein